MLGFSCHQPFDSYWKPFSNVPSVEPAVFIQGLCSLLRVFQVPLEHISSLYTDLKRMKSRLLTFYILNLQLVGI